MENNEKGVVKNVGTGRSPAGRGGALSFFESSTFAGWGLALALSLGAVGSSVAAPSDSSPPIAFAELPVEAQQTDKLILAGGPFPYSRDGIVFMNREGRLAREPRGYYHEYTVPTPGAHDRGARRIICGGPRLTEPEACFFTQDHYNSFHRILN